MGKELHLPENIKKACLAVYCNGWRECFTGFCEAEWWCKFHPDFKEEEDE